MVRCNTAGTYTIKTGTTTLMSLSVSGTAVTTSALASWKPTFPDYLTDLTGDQTINSGAMCIGNLGGSEGRILSEGDNLRRSL